MSEKPTLENKSSRTVDLSTDKEGKPKKRSKGFAPLVQQTINLSMPKEERPDPKSQYASEKRTPMKQAKKKENREPRSQGNSLADLLDPETLAKLRGNQ